MTNSKPKYNKEERAFEFKNKCIELREATIELKKVFRESIEKSHLIFIVLKI
jgi:hypothetical protein